MSVAVGANANHCLNLQRSLVSKEGTPAGKVEETGMLDGLKRVENTAGFVAKDYINIEGKELVVQVRYDTPNCGTTNTTAAGLCDTAGASTPPYKFLDVSVDKVRSDKIEVSISDFRTLCESPNERISSDIRRMSQRILADIDTDLITDAYALMGNYSDGASSKGATARNIMVTNANQHINPAAWVKPKSEFRLQGSSQAPIVVGGTMLAEMHDTRILGGFGSNALGANMTASTRTILDHYDSKIDATIQAIETDTLSHAISWTRGSMQFIEKELNVGDFRQVKEDYSEIVLTIDGIKFDYAANYDKCTKKWVLSLTKHFDLFYIPDAEYLPCTAGNHKLHWNLICGTPTC